MSTSKNTSSFILETSAVLFLKHGYEGTSLSMLTKATGLTKGAIYGNFKDKAALADACFEYSFSQVEKALLSALNTQDHPKVCMRAFFAYYRSYDQVISQLGSCPLISFGMTKATNEHLGLHPFY